MNRRFKHIIHSSKPVLIDFYTDWCQPCKEVRPILEKIQKEVKQVKVIKVNVDRNPFIATQYQINRVPTLMVFKNGRPQWTGEGVRSADEIKTILQQHL